MFKCLDNSQLLQLKQTLTIIFEDEDYIIKSPVRRIHKVKTACNIKETYSDED